MPGNRRQRPVRVAAPRERHPQRGPAEHIRALHGESADDGDAAGPNPPRNVSRRKCAGVEQHDPRQSLAHSQHRAKADGAAPILRDERHTIKLQRYR